MITTYGLRLLNYRNMDTGSEMRALVRVVYVSSFGSRDNS